MKIRQLSSVFLLLIASLHVHAGAWDTGPFDNDDALDWAWALESSTDLSVVKRALESVGESGSYIQAPTASEAIAAAEVVAALKGKPHALLPENVLAWVEEHSLDGNEALVELSIQVIARVQDSDESELAQLWSDSQFLKEWQTGLSDLKKRLQ